MSILITGFEPYRKYKLNPSWEVAKTLNGQSIDGEQILSRRVPVSYRKVIKEIPKIIDETRPKIFLGLGLASTKPNITVERVAINIMDSEKPDNDGFKPTDEPIVPNGPAAYFATIPVKLIISELRRNGIPAMISNSAGTFVCNTLMYIALHHIKERQYNTLAGFIHLPALPIQVLDKSQPSMSLDLMVKGIKIAIHVSLKYLNSI